MDWATVLVIVIESEPAEASTISESIQRNWPEATIVTVDTLTSTRRILETQYPDLIVSNLHLADGTALELLNGSADAQPYAVVILSDDNDQTTAVHALKSGALDYLVKSPSTLESLATSLQRSLREWRVIRERKCALDALRESERNYREVVEAANSIILRIDRNGTITFFNEFAEKFFGFELSEVFGKNVVGTIVPETESSGRDLAELMDDIWRRPEAYTLNENENIKKSGERVWIQWANRPLLDETGKLVGILAVGNDVSDRRRMEAQLRQSQKMEAIGQLAGGVAHDFNNLLQAIIGYGELMRDSIVPGSDQEMELHEILKAAKRASNLTRQLLAFSRRQVLDPKPLRMNSLVSDMHKMIHRVIGEHIELKIATADNVPNFTADAGQFDQVIMNLCVNARDAMPDGGILTIATASVSFDDTYCTLHKWAKPGEYVMLSVSDTGCGMDSETLSHIFEPFFTTKDVDKGTGLGLATVYGIVKQHNGFIHVYSEVGHGTCFKLYFPTTDQVAVSSTFDSDFEPRGGTETILLAEDEDQVREFIRRFLKSAGYTVLSASNGEEALELYRSMAPPPDCLLLDVVMPKVSGKIVLEQVLPIRPDVKCLFASGYSDEAFAGALPLSERVLLIQKPYHPNDLLHKLRTLLDL